LRGEDAVAALLLLDDGRYIVQLRDAIPQIFYPDHWGCFGGAVNPREAPLDGLYRELFEELEFYAEGATEFTRLDFDLGMIGASQKRVYRIYYEIRVTSAAFERFTLHEGAEYRAFVGTDLLGSVRVVPYDAFVIWLHMHRARFR
jgi:8-oxo-dGTP pyrophosphatase MutT (NUDIX family)